MAKALELRDNFLIRLGSWTAAVAMAGCQAGVMPDGAPVPDSQVEDATLTGADAASEFDAAPAPDVDKPKLDVAPVPDALAQADESKAVEILEDIGAVDQSGGGADLVEDMGCSTTKASTDTGPPMKFGGQAESTIAHKAVQWQPWTSGHPIAVHGDQVLALDADNGTLVRIDRKTMQVLGKLVLGGQPQALVVAPDGTIYVTLRAAGTVAKVSAELKLLATWTVGTEPMGLALAADLGTLYVAVAGDRKILAMNPVTGAVTGEGMTGPHPTAVVALSQAVVVLDRLEPVRKYATTKLVPGGTDPGSLLLLSGSHGTVGVCSQPGNAIRALAAVRDPEGDTVQVAHVVAAPGNVQTSLKQAGKCTQAGGSYGSDDGCKLARRPVELAVSWLLHTNANAGTYPGIIGAPSGEILAALFDQPTDIAAHPTHQLLLVAARGTDNVLVLGVSPSGNVTPLAGIDVGKAPSGIAVADDGKTAYVLNEQDFSVAAIDLQSLLTFPGGQALMLQQGASVQIGEDPLAEPLRLGRRTFTFARNPALSQDGQFACATCHLDGAEDGQTWFIAAGPRQTPALAERLPGTAPFNWLGSHDILTDNMADTVQRMGGKGLSAAEVASLEKFLLTGLHAPQHPPAASSEQVAAGKKLFESPQVGCSGCHIDGKTDGKSHDVATMSDADFQVQAQTKGVKPTGLAFDTPSLKGLFATAPYLHDGSAPNLDAVLKLSDQGKMGATKDLTDVQRGQLKAYLMSL